MYLFILHFDPKKKKFKKVFLPFLNTGSRMMTELNIFQ